MINPAQICQFCAQRFEAVATIQHMNSYLPAGGLSRFGMAPRPYFQLDCRLAELILHNSFPQIYWKAHRRVVQEVYEIHQTVLKSRESRKVPSPILGKRANVAV